MKMYQEIYEQSVIQQIEFESELIIPKYFKYEYVEFTSKTADQFGISRRMAFRLIFKESSFIDTVKSPVGAKGLMQLMPDTRSKYYKILRVDTLNFDKNKEDIYIGLYYLKDLREYWKKRGNSEKVLWKLALAGYNAGPPAVIKHKGIPPYKQTIDFVTFINSSHSNPVFYSNILKKNTKKDIS
jgi:soluble lytic murein transglycosylase-like protein